MRRSEKGVGLWSMCSWVFILGSCMTSHKVGASRPTSEPLLVTVSLPSRDSLPFNFRSSLTHYQLNISGSDSSQDLSGNDSCSVSGIEAESALSYSEAVTLTRELRQGCAYFVTLALGTPDKSRQLLTEDFLQDLRNNQEVQEEVEAEGMLPPSDQDVPGASLPSGSSVIKPLFFAGQEKVFVANGARKLLLRMILREVGGPGAIDLAPEAGQSN